MVVAILILFAGVMVIKAKASPQIKGKLSIKSLTEQMDQLKKVMESKVLDKKDLKLQQNMHITFLIVKSN